MKQERN